MWRGRLSRNETGHVSTSILAGSYTSPPTRPGGEKGGSKNVPHSEVRGSRMEGGRVKGSAQGGARFWHRGRCQKDPSTVHPKGFGWLVGAALYTLKELGGW